MSKIEIRKGTLSQLNIRDIFKNLNMIYEIVRRDIVVFHKQTALGPFWQIINPLIQSGIFVLIFSNLAKLNTDNIPPFLFYASGMLVWTSFYKVSNFASEIFISYGNILRSIYIPKICLFASIIVHGMYIFFVNLLIFTIIYLIYLSLGITIEFNFFLLIFLLPIIFFLSTLSTLVGLIIAFIGSTFRDLKFFLQYALQSLFYFSPIIYSINSIPEKFKLFFYLNPLVFFIDFFKRLFFSTSSIDQINYIIASIVIFLLIIVVFYLLFKKISAKIIDYV